MLRNKHCVVTHAKNVPLYYKTPPTCNYSLALKSALVSRSAVFPDVASLTFHQSRIPAGEYAGTVWTCEGEKGGEGRMRLKGWCYSFTSFSRSSCFIFFLPLEPARMCPPLCIFHSVLLWPCWTFSTSIQPSISYVLLLTVTEIELCHWSKVCWFYIKIQMPLQCRRSWTKPLTVAIKAKSSCFASFWLVHQAGPRWTRRETAFPLKINFLDVPHTSRCVTFSLLMLKLVEL